MKLFGDDPAEDLITAEGSKPVYIVRIWTKSVWDYEWHGPFKGKVEAWKYAGWWIKYKDAETDVIELKEPRQSVFQNNN